METQETDVMLFITIKMYRYITIVDLDALSSSRECVPDRK